MRYVAMSADSGMAPKILLLKLRSCMFEMRGSGLPGRPPKESTPWDAALGNAATPQRHEHWQAPVESKDPDPVVKLELEVEEPVAADPATATVEVLGVPPAMTAVVPVPF